MNPDEAIKAIRAQGGTDADVEAYLRSIGAEEVKAAPAEPTTVDNLRKAAGFAGAFSDAATFGLGGLVADAGMAARTGMGVNFREKFAQNRADRRANQSRLSGTERLATTLAGAIANPVGAVVRAPQGAGLLMRGLAAGTDAALQGGVTAGAEGLDELTPEGVRAALESAGSGAFGSVVGAGLLRGGMSLAHGAQTLGRVARAPTIDVRGAQMDDARRAADEMFFGIAREEAKQIGTTPALRAILEHPTVRPFAEAQRKRPINAGASDAEIFLNAYRRMSEVERRNLNSQEGAAELLAKIRDETEDIAFVKPMMKDATATRGTVVVPGRAIETPPLSTAQSPAPSVRDAIEAHRTRLGKTVTRREGTVMQQQAREALERQDMEKVAAPPLRGAPQPMRAVVRESETIDIPEGMPTFPIANAVHAAHRRDKEAFVNVADAVSRIMRKASQKGEEKIQFESPEALRRGILDMTPSEAEAAIDGLLGRGREAFRLSANPLTGFGIPGAAIRTALLPSQVNPYLRLLEKQAGRQPRLFDNPVVTERALGTTARTVGGLLSDR